MPWWGTVLFVIWGIGAGGVFVFSALAWGVFAIVVTSKGGKAPPGLFRIFWVSIFWPFYVRFIFKRLDEGEKETRQW